VYVAFEGLSIHDDDIYALATLQILLGGGGSFSAGGPGKGMYSRLYTNVLNQHHSVDYCAAFHHCYSDSGLFGISASVHPSFNSSIVHVIARELELCTSSIYQGSVTQTELNRAKNQLKSSLVMALESRLVEVEDLGRQIQAHGKKVSVEEMCEKIDQVDLKTLNRVATRVLRPQKMAVGTGKAPRGSAQATVVAQGNLEGLGDVRDLLARRGLGVSPKHTA
jgi:processing peptidase subunit alpha